MYKYIFKDEFEEEKLENEIKEFLKKIFIFDKKNLWWFLKETMSSKTKLLKGLTKTSAKKAKEIRTGVSR